MKNITAIFALLALTFVTNSVSAMTDEIENFEMVSADLNFETPVILDFAVESETFLKKDAEIFGSLEYVSYISNVINNETDMNNLERLIEKLNGITGVSFVSIKNYTNAKGETSDVLVNVGVSYEKAKEKDYETLSNLDVATLKTDIDNALLEEARLALMKSLVSPEENRSNGQKATYTYIGNGIKVHNEWGTVYVNAMAVKKTIKESGDYKADTRKPLTKAKDFFRNNIMKSRKYRNYSFDQFKEVTISGETITFEL